MSRRALALGVPFAVIAISGSACRAIVGITDLTVDGGAIFDAARDRTHSDSGDARTDAHDAGAPPDATSDAPHDSPSDAPSDAASERSDATDVTDAGSLMCDAEAPPDASVGRQGCIQGCIDGHTLAAPAFYGASPPCVCKHCGTSCEAFCSPACPKTTPTGACLDCATHAYVDEGGVCHDFEDTTCTAGCGSYATCIGACPSN
jgi:hypothetical protein